MKLKWVGWGLTLGVIFAPALIPTLRNMTGVATADSGKTLSNAPPPAHALQPDSYGDVSKIAEVRIETALTSLQEGRDGVLYIVVRNKSNIPITVTKVTLDEEEPNSIAVTPSDIWANIVVQPQETHPLKATIRTVGQVETGKQVLLFNVSLSWEKDGLPRSGSLLAAMKFDVGVLGESELLKLVGVPSLYLLPGFLIVVVWQMLRSASGSLPENTKQWAKTDPQFWVIAVVVSFLVAFAYPPITRLWLGVPHDYRKAYNTADIFFIWVGSLVVGFVSFWLWKSCEKIRAFAVSLKVPSPEDSPATILRKLHRNKLGFPLDAVEVNGETEFFFTVHKDKDWIWIAPQICYSKKAQRGESFLQKVASTSASFKRLITKARLRMKFKKSKWLSETEDPSKAAEAASNEGGGKGPGNLADWIAIHSAQFEFKWSESEVTKLTRPKKIMNGQWTESSDNKKRNFVASCN